MRKMGKRKLQLPKNSRELRNSRGDNKVRRLYAASAAVGDTAVLYD